MPPIILYVVYRGEPLSDLQATIDSVSDIINAVVIINQVDAENNNHSSSSTSTRQLLRKQLRWEGQCKIYSDPQRIKKKSWSGYLLMLPVGAILTNFDREQIQDNEAYYIKIENSIYQHHHLLLIKNTADVSYYQPLTLLDPACGLVKGKLRVPESYWLDTLPYQEEKTSYSDDCEAVLPGQSIELREHEEEHSSYWDLADANDFEGWLQAMNDVPFRYEAPYQLLRYCVKNKLYHFGWIVAMATLRNRQQVGTIRQLFVRKDIENWQFYDLGAHCSVHDNHHRSAINLLTLALPNAQGKELARLRENLENVKNQNGKDQEPQEDRS